MHALAWIESRDRDLSFDFDQAPNLGPVRSRAARPAAQN